MFGQSTNNWSSSTGFGNQQAKPNAFGLNTAPTTSNTGLFGNSQQNQPSSGGLFGNTQQSAPSGGGLFGNTQQTSTSGGGLFGNKPSTTTLGGLFGNSQQTKPASGGLFGTNQSTTNTTTSGGLFGNSQQLNTNTSGGLFGNTQQSNMASSGGLFGNTQQSNPGTNSLFGKPQASTGSGLFGNSSNTSTGLGTNTGSGGLFGSKPATVGGSTGLFGGQSSNSFGSSSNTGGINGTNTINQQSQLSKPYNANELFTRLKSEEASLPKSITENLFAQNLAKEYSDKKRKFSYLEKPDSTKSSLLSRLGQTLKIFRTSTVNASLNPIKGLFSQANYLNGVAKKTSLPTTIEVESKNGYRPSKRAIINSARSGSMKRLIIKSKPLKFHLIDADKVFNSKRRRIVPNVVLADKLLSEAYSSDEDDDDNEIEMIAKLKYAKRMEPNVSSKKDNKVMAGESLKVEELVEETKEQFDDGYWCSPPLKHLLQLPDENLAHVENFIVGRHGYGQIAYDYPVDLTGVIRQAISSGITVDKQLFGKNKVVNLAKHGQVEVYLNYPTSKPVLGAGLNVPATITLEEIKPSTGTTTPEFIKKLKSQTGQEFLTYDPFKFVWVFRVKHFSVWGLIDDNSELNDVKRKQDDDEEATALEYTRIYENEKYEQELKKQKLSQHTKDLPGGWKYNVNNEQLPLVAKRGLVAKEVSDRIKLYKQAGQDVGNVDEVMDVDSDSGSKTSELLMTDVIAPTIEDRNFDYLRQMVSVLPRDTDYKEIVDEKAYEPELDNTAQFDSIQFKPNLAVSSDWLVQLELANDLNSPLVPIVAQKPSKLNIQKLNDILFEDVDKDLMNVDKDSGPKKQSDADLEHDQDINSENVVEIMGELLSKSVISSRNNKIPILERIDGLSFASLITEQQSKEEQELIQLGRSLFDDDIVDKECLDITGSDPELKKHVREISRKKVFGEWLTAFNIKTIEPYLKDSKHDKFEYAFLQLCSGNLTGAIETMIEANNNHLSVILTLVDSNEDTVITLAKNQLDDWKNNGVFNSIPVGCVKIYKLLAHDFDDILKTLPWNIELGVKLMYGDSSITLCELIKTMNLVESNGIVDLLKTYVDVEEKSTSDLLALAQGSLNPKLRWLVYLVISNKYYELSKKNDDLTIKMGEYLLRQGMWKQAIYVYLTLSDDSEAEKREREIIFDHIGSISDAEEGDLVDRLRFPSSLIFEAKASKAEQEKNYWYQGESLISAKLWEQAHDVLIEQLGPQTVVSNGVDVKHQLLALIEKFPEQGTIVPEWSKGGGIYKKYVEMEVHKSKDVDSVKWLLSTMPFIKPPTNFLSQTAIKIMARKTGDLATETISDLTRNQILNLPLSPQDRQYFTIRLAH
jgi:nucleoporin NUP145